MADLNHDQLLKETYQLVRDNNRMLHAMRRNAFFGGVFKLIMYALFIGVPIWFYLTYVHPMLNTMVGALNEAQSNINQVKDMGTQFGAKFEGLDAMVDKLKEIPGVGDLGGQQ